MSFLAHWISKIIPTTIDTLAARGLRNLRDYGRKERGGKEREWEINKWKEKDWEIRRERETKREREIKRGGKDIEREKRDFATVPLYSFGLGSTWWLWSIQIWVSFENPIFLLFSLSCVILAHKKKCQQDNVLLNHQN